MALNITSGRISRAQKIVVYGSEGIGKTSFAARFPNPLFLDTEGGTAHMDVNRLEMPAAWDSLVALVEEVSRNPGICGTFVMDTADWAEQLCIRDLCAKYKKAGIEEFGYGKGYTYLAEEFVRLLAACDKVIASGMNVLITAHAKMRKFELPDEMGAYDRWEMKLTKQVAPLIKEWSDMLLFCNYKTYVVEQETGKSKGQGGKRVIYTSHHPCWDAKNRHGLPAEIGLDFQNIAHQFRTDPDPAADTEAPLDRLRSLMEESNVTEEELQKVVADKGHYPADDPIESYTDKFISGWIIRYWPQVMNLINTNRKTADETRRMDHD